MAATIHPKLRRFYLYLWLALCFLLFSLRIGISVGDIALFVLAVLGMEAGSYLLARTARPRRSYLIAALASIVLGALAIGLQRGSNPWLPLIFWSAVTAIAFFWAWYWERTEPLPETSV